MRPMRRGRRLADPAVEDRPETATEADGFEDVPEPLAGWVRAIPPGLSRRARNAMAAGLVVSWYLGRDRLAGDDDTFLRNRKDIPDAHLMARLLGIAEALFLLRSHAGFGALCAQLEARSLQAAFFELSTARRLADAGFAIAECDPSGRLLAVRGADAIELMQACFEAKRFSPATVREQLNRIEQGFSGTRPALVACHYPGSWALDRWDIDFDLGSISSEFLAGSDIVNLVGFYREAFIETDLGLAHSLEGFTETNRSPRHPSLALEAVLRRRAGPHDRAGDDRQAEAASASALLQWVDSMLGDGP